MNNKQNNKIRLVKCPKCAKLLPEPEHVPLYTCGGCGTTLQAKYYRGNGKELPLTSHEREVKRSNGIIHARNGGESNDSSRKSSSSVEHTEAQDRGRDQDGIKNSRTCEQNGVVNSSDHTPFSKDSRFLQNKENGVVDRKVDQSDLKDQNRERDQDAVERCSDAERNGAANYSEHTVLREESSFIESNENEGTDSEIGSKNHVANGFPTVLEKKVLTEDGNDHDEQCDGIVADNHQQKQIGVINEREALPEEDSQVLENGEGQKVALVKRSTEDDYDDQKEVAHISSSAIANTAERFTSALVVSEVNKNINLVGEHIHQDQHEEKQIGFVNSSIEASPLTVSSAIQNVAEHQAFDHEVYEDTRKMHHVGKQLYRDQPEPKQAELVNSSIEASFLTESSSINDLAEHDASVSKESRDMHLVGKHFQQNQHEREQIEDMNSSKNASVSSSFENPVKHDAFDHEVSEEIRKVHFVENHFDQYQPEERQVVCANSAKNASSLNESPAIKNRSELDAFHHQVSEVTRVIPLVGQDSHHDQHEQTQEMGTSIVSRDPHHGSNTVEDDKGTLKQNVKSFGDDAVYTDNDVGSLMTDVTRYPKQMSPAYDGSVSSFDDQMEEQPAQVEETLSPTNAVAGYDGAEESPEWNHTLPDRMIYRNSRFPTQGRSSSSIQLDKKLKSSVIDGGPPEGYDIPRRTNRYRPHRDSFLPRVPNPRRSTEIAFEAGSSSSYALHDEVPSHQMHHHLYRRRFPEVPVWREKEFLSTHYNYETSGEIYDRPNYYHAYGDRRRRAGSWSQSGTLPRMPYSGEIFNGRHPYMHRYPDDRRWSAQLPPPAVCFHQGVYMDPTWETRHDPYDSYPTSPQRYVESESSCAWGHDAVSLSDDQRRRDQIMRRLYLKEKRQALKEQFHPTAGGAPFISCYFCFNILQLPKGFLVPRGRTKRTHKLQCGACSSVLEFSLENEGGLAPSETNVDRHASQPVSSSSHVNHSRHSSLTSVDGRELLSRNSFGASGREQTKLAHGSSRTRERMERLHHDDDDHSGRGRTGKVTWKLPARSKSPLHRLMGYSSPQDLLSAPEADDVN